MLEQINKLKKEIAEFHIDNQDSLQAFRMMYLVKKGKINALFEVFRDLDGEGKRDAGKPLNELKTFATEKFNNASSEIGSESKEKKATASIDKSLPVQSAIRGGIHPITLVINEITSIFSRIGYNLKDGPEIEDDWHNFSALNFEENHPARDMQDTFFISKDLALRTHTSSVQVRVMEKEKPPIRVLCPGRVYRNEAVSARSNCFFHQIEGLCIDEKVSMADMKQTLYYFVQEFFGKNTPVRFRASYFPFTEPSAEMDVFLGTETEEDYRLTKGTGWLEIMGCGMVDPNVLKNVNIDTEKYSGFAFGMGVDRIAMFRYGIKDIRTMFENDIRFLSQFKSL
jgi:phenylalanyl-tRNA synthetase alpha chain